MTTSRRSVSCRKLLLLKLQMFSILIIFLESVPQKVLANHPYTFVKPLPNVDTASSKIIQHQPSKNTYNIAPDSFHRRERSGLFLGWKFLANFLFLQWIFPFWIRKSKWLHYIYVNTLILPHNFENCLPPRFQCILI